MRLFPAEFYGVKPLIIRAFSVFLRFTQRAVRCGYAATGRAWAYESHASRNVVGLGRPSGQDRRVLDWGWGGSDGRGRSDNSHHGASASTASVVAQKYLGAHASTTVWGRL